MLLFRKPATLNSGKHYRGANGKYRSERTFSPKTFQFQLFNPETSAHLAVSCTMFALTSLGGCLASSAAACACSCCTMATKEALKSSARVAWSILFTFSLLFAWILRDFAKPLISKIPWIMKQFGGESPPDEWFGKQAVYRLSMGNFVSSCLSIHQHVKYVTREYPQGHIYSNFEQIKVAFSFNFVVLSSIHPSIHDIQTILNFSSISLSSDALHSHGCNHVLPCTCQIHQ